MKSHEHPMNITIWLADSSFFFGSITFLLLNSPIFVGQLTILAAELPSFSIFSG